MKELIAAALIAVVLVSGCVDTGTTTTCAQYCQDQPHIQCTGSWDISGTYPDCTCSWICENPEPTTCEEYCEGQTHIQCVGEWNISGAYPDCTCAWECEVTEPGRIDVSQKPDDVCDYQEVTLGAGKSVDVYVDGQKHVLNVTKINAEKLATIVVDKTFIKTFGLLEPFETLGGVGINVRDIVYSGESHVTMRIGENRVNSPIDCYGLQ